MRYIVLLLCFFYYHTLFKTKPVYAAEKCPAGEISTTIKTDFKFDRVDAFARAETDTATINSFPATSEQFFCRRPKHEVFIRQVGSGNWFEVRFDKQGRQVSVVPK